MHGKGSLIGKMPGDEWQKFAGLRLLFGYMYTHPGKKLLFMGGEIGQWSEWNRESSIEWGLLNYPTHSGLRHWIGDLNALYRREPTLHRFDSNREGFEWVDLHDEEQSVITYLRKDPAMEDVFLVSCNFTPIPRQNYRIGVPGTGLWREVLNSDAKTYGGSGQGNMGGVRSTPVPSHGRSHSISVTLPPLGVVVFHWER